jgi:RND family efflux transporter MFP subunit
MDEAGYPDVARRAHSLVQAARERLLYWDVDTDAIARLEETREVSRTVTLVSPVKGILLEKAADSLEGMYARRGMNIYKLADLSRIWAEVSVYESQMAHVRVGERVRIEVPSDPGRPLEGRVRFLEPSLNRQTRTLTASIELPNPTGRLRDEMFVDVFFDVPAASDVMTVPDEAVIHSGLRKIVVVDLGGGVFEARDVELGVNAEERWEVTEGLEEGERVVVSAQFLIDSESNLNAAIRRLAPGAPAPAEHVH